MTTQEAWASYFARHKKVTGKEDIHIHELVIRNDDEFPAGDFWAYEVSRTVHKLVGLHTSGVYLAHAYGFDSSDYSEKTARDWISQFASGLDPVPTKGLLKFKANFEKEIITHPETGRKVVNMFGVQCAAVGEWKGRQWSVEDLAESVEVDKVMHGIVKPKFKIEHVYSGPSMGDLENYTHKGEDGNEVDIMSVPFELYQDIVELRYTGLSPEFYRVKVNPETGVAYERVFAGLALLGVQQPAMSKIKKLVGYEKNLESNSFEMDSSCELMCLGLEPEELLKDTAAAAEGSLMTYAIGIEPEGRSEPETCTEDGMTKEELEALEAKNEKERKRLETMAEEQDTKRKELITREVNSEMKILVKEGRIDPKETDTVRDQLCAIEDDAAREAVLSARKAVPEGTYSKKEEGAGNPDGKPKDEVKDPRPPDERFGELVDKVLKDNDWDFSKYGDACLKVEEDPRNKDLMAECAEQFKGDAPSDIAENAVATHSE